MKDLTIIGAGPAGLFAGFYAGLRNLSTQIIDSLPQVGGQPFALFPDKLIHDIAGIPEIYAKDLTHNLMEQLSSFEHTTSFFLNHEVKNFQSKGTYFDIQTENACFQSRAILLATGGGTFRPRKINLLGSESFKNSGLYYSISEYQHFANARVAVCGGGDSAVDHALALSNVAEHVYIIHRRPQFRALEYHVDLLKEKSNVTFLTPYIPIEISGDNGQLQTITIQKARETTTTSLPIDACIMAYGFSTTASTMAEWPIESSQNRIPVDSFMRTSHSGIFAVGDVADYPGKSKLITCGFGEVPIAINTIALELYPDRKLAPIPYAH